ncbi:hypothetical protein [Nocardia sp. NPDC047654]|uniref:hypothetical protein n=1 Tax=Nocardia sp. NPDC047654 TaxID=3364314 RepID=UPI00371C0502
MAATLAVNVTNRAVDKAFVASVNSVRRSTKLVSSTGVLRGREVCDGRHYCAPVVDDFFRSAGVSPSVSGGTWSAFSSTEDPCFRCDTKVTAVVQVVPDGWHLLKAISAREIRQ